VNAFRPALWIVCLSLSAEAALPSPHQGAVQSASGQFSVLPWEPPGRFSGSVFLSEAGLLRLDPTLLTVSAERLRQHLTRELQDASPWEGRVVFSLRAARGFEEPVDVLAEWRGDAWQYRVSLPEYIERDRFVRALVEVNLMEMANRTANGRVAEVPLWLTEGLAAQLLASRAVEIILPPPRLELNRVTLTPWTVEEVNYQPLAAAHAQLRTNTPLSIEQLSWPEPGALEGRKGDAYRDCAQLLVNRLLQMPEGPARFNAFVRNLGRHYNWQVAFLDTYGEPFPTLLALEKWWALQVADFTGRELGATYPYAESVRRLNEAVRLPVEVRLATNDLPMLGTVPLQTVVDEWDANRQSRALTGTLSRLTLLRARIAPDLVPLLDDYRLAIENYLRHRNRSGLYLPKGMNRQASLTILIRRTIRTLDALDAERASLLPAPDDEPSLADAPR